MNINHEIVRELREIADEFRSLKHAMLFQEDEDDLIELVGRLETVANLVDSD